MKHHSPRQDCVRYKREREYRVGRMVQRQLCRLYVISLDMAERYR